MSDKLDKLYNEINSKCVVIGSSQRAYEIYNGDLYRHTTYGYIAEDENINAAIDGLKADIFKIIKSTGEKRPLIFWRRRPTITYVNGRSCVSCRLSIVRARYNPKSLHNEGEKFTEFTINE